MKIHLFDSDERQFTDKENYPYNHGPLSEVCIQLNKELKKTGHYSEPDNADYVGTHDGLNVAFRYKNKIPFIIHTWASTSLPCFVYDYVTKNNIRLFGISNQVTDLWKKYGYQNIETIYDGCDVDFWKPTIEKTKDKFVFLHVTASSSVCILDLLLPAFAQAFPNNTDVLLKITDSHENPILEEKIKKYSKNANIEYKNARLSFLEMRDLYSSSHVCFNVQRGASFGLTVCESMACGCFDIIGNIAASNEIVNENVSKLIQPGQMIPIYPNARKICDEWGFVNTYGNFECLEPPFYHDYNINEISKSLLDVYNNWNKYKKIDTRKYIIDNWTWDKPAKRLIKSLENW